MWVRILIGMLMIAGIVIFLNGIRIAIISEFHELNAIIWLLIGSMLINVASIIVRVITS